jgi:hypothetical protein
MPRVPNRLKLGNVDILGVGTTTVTTGAQGTPFCQLLSHTSGTVVDFNTDLSASPTDCVMTHTADFVITYMAIIVCDSDVAQFTGFPGTNFVGNLGLLSNGLLFRVKDNSSNVVLSLNPNAITNQSRLLSFSTDAFVGHYTAQATAANNYSYIIAYVNFQQKFGGALTIPAGYSFVCTLQDNFSTLSAFNISVSGFYL